MLHHWEVLQLIAAGKCSRAVSESSIADECEVRFTLEVDSDGAGVVAGLESRMVWKDKWDARPCEAIPGGQIWTAFDADGNEVTDYE